MATSITSSHILAALTLLHSLTSGAMATSASASASATATATATASDYCSPALCTKGIHVACNSWSPGGINPDSCPADTVQVALSPQQRQQLLDLHNAERQQVADGQYPSFPSSNRMSELQWSDELAYVAGRNSASCRFAHDDCRNTPSAPKAGQNIAIVGQSGDQFVADDAAIAQLFKMWVDERTDCSLATVRSFQLGGGPPIGHFTQVVHGNCDRVGCALSRFRQAGDNKSYLVCNYQETNINGRPVYAEGAAAANCPAGRSARWTALCRTEGGAADGGAAQATAQATVATSSHSFSSREDDGRTQTAVDENSSLVLRQSSSATSSTSASLSPQLGANEVAVQIAEQRTPTSVVTTRTSKLANGATVTQVTTRSLSTGATSVSTTTSTSSSSNRSSSLVGQQRRRFGRMGRLGRTMNVGRAWPAFGAAAFAFGV